MTNGSRKRILIVGAGPSGLAAALAVRAAGHEPVVVEKGRRESAQVGGGLHLWNNATRALGDLGALDRVRDAGVVVERFEWYTTKGKTLGIGDVSQVTQRVGAPALGLTRADLFGALLDTVGPDAVRFGRELTGFSQAGDGTVVGRFADGEEEAADGLIGADGVGSVVRRQVVGETELRFSGIVVCQATSPLETGHAYVMVFGRGVRMGYYPVRDKTHWYLLITAAQGSFAGGGECHRETLERVRGWSGAASELVESTPAAQVLRGDISGRDPVENWGDERVTLIGDAAHAMTPFQGQGASLGLEDAAVLARCLREEGDVPTAFRRYEELRKPRTADVTRKSWTMGQRGRVANPIACAIRDRIIRRTFARSLWPDHERMVSYQY